MTLTSPLPNEQDSAIVEKMTANQHRFVVSVSKFNELLALIETPLPSGTNLQRLATLPSPFSVELP
jgi:uncharacterized protein (DUF1778 family)